MNVIALIGGTAFLVSLPVLLWRELRKFRKRPAPEANSVYRKIVRWEPDLPEIQFLVLECGHKVPIVAHRLTDCRCDICTNEVEQLRQMAGTK